MADSNVNYNGFAEQVNIENYQTVLYPLYLYNGLEPTQEQFDAFADANPDIRDKINQAKQFNQDSFTTIAAVKVAYNGTTDAQRVDWINQRLAAIIKRATLVKGRVDAIVQGLQNAGISGADTAFLGVWSLTFSAAIPVVGSILSGLFLGKIKQDQQDYINDQKALLVSYQTDIEQLTDIQKQLKAELASKEVKDNAPNPYAKYYIIGGIVLGVLVLYVLYRRTHKRRKR